jgi:hypothetical protein
MPNIKSTDKGKRPEKQGSGRSDQFVPRYQPEDDTYCWLCNGPVDKRHCKIICRVCGFMRDCSDP